MTVGTRDTPNSSVHPFAWALLAGHFVVWLFLQTSGLLNSATAAVEPFCWPYFESCWRFRLPTADSARAAVWLYLFLGIVAGSALGANHRRGFYAALTILNLYLFALVSLDYRLRANEFYMLFWTNGVFLLTRQPQWTVPVTIVSFYFWAGRLKLNHEWLSGELLYSELWFTPGWAVAYACAYVVALEMVLIWGLLSARQWVVVLTLAQLALFHLESLSQIHWFYPLLMASILSWFPIQRWVVGGEIATLPKLTRSGAPATVFVVVGVFAGAQMFPVLKNARPELTGDGRVLALHMFEARQDCRVSAVPHGGSAEGPPIDLKQLGLSPRMVCDPAVYVSRAKALCRKGLSQNPQWDFRFFMDAKTSSESDFTTIIDEANYCSSEHDFRVLFPNPWLRARP